MKPVRRIAATLAPLLTLLVGGMAPSRANAISMTCLYVASSAVPGVTDISQPRALVGVLAPSWPDFLIPVIFYVHITETTNFSTVPPHVDGIAGIVPPWVSNHVHYTLFNYPRGDSTLVSTGLGYDPWGFATTSSACAATGVI